MPCSTYQVVSKLPLAIYGHVVAILPIPLTPHGVKIQSLKTTHAPKTGLRPTLSWNGLQYAINAFHNAQVNFGSA